MPEWEAEGISSANVTGKITVLAVWATWCHPCQEELPALDAMARRLHKDGVDVAVVAISVDARREVYQRWVEKHPLGELRLAWAPHLMEAFGVSALPRSWLVGADGVVVATHHGYSAGDDAVLEREVRELAEAARR